ncbi:MoaD/ThiS family protein [Candidatus Sumerlaeota bacterium]|nr:MoaD/ThiS family protein [Candidatus Sumerlaeota bacterium]
MAQSPSTDATIHVRFYGPLRQFAGAEETTHTVAAGRSIRKLIVDLGVPEGHLVYTMCLVNGRRVPLDTPISDGDRVDVFQPIAGG